MKSYYFNGLALIAGVIATVLSMPWSAIPGVIMLIAGVVGLFLQHREGKSTYHEFGISDWRQTASGWELRLPTGMAALTLEALGPDGWEQCFADVKEDNRGCKIEIADNQSCKPFQGRIRIK